ncbi:MAG TPA: hypothetical protein ENI77_01735 [Nitrospirae bacterium]|nr:hypothetical protein [Nitrospirota bacterium]
MLPNYLVIGGARCATTWAHNCLSEHPEIFTPKVKELNFFNTNYDKGIEYYEKYFDDASNGSFRAVGEASPTYLPHAECPERIARYSPNVKLIVILRNPIERAFSHYLIFKHKHEESSFEEAIEKRPQLLSDGLYSDHLLRYYKYFSKDQLLLLFFDDIEKDPVEFIQRVYRFLDVNDHFLPRDLENQVNMVFYPGFQNLIRWMRLGFIIELVKMTPLDGLIRRLSQSKKLKSYPAIKPETREKLVQYFTIPNKKLSRLTERDLSHWI